MKQKQFLTVTEVRQRLFEACEELGSQRAFAMKHNLSIAFVNDVVRGLRVPSETICEILKITRKGHRSHNYTYEG